MMIAPILSVIILVITIYYEYKFVKNHKRLSYPWSEYSKKYIISLSLFLLATLVVIFSRGNRTIIDVASIIYTVSYFYIIYLGYSVFQRAEKITSQKTIKHTHCKIRTAGAYYLFDPSPEKIKLFAPFSKCIIAVSRKTSKQWEKEYGFAPQKLLWVSRSSIKGAVDPSRLHYISHEILDFVAENGKAIVLIDCIDFLLLYNDFRSTMKFLISLKDNVLMHDSIIVVVTAEKTLSHREKSIIEKEFQPFKNTVLIESTLYFTIPRKQ